MVLVDLSKLFQLRRFLRILGSLDSLLDARTDLALVHALNAQLAVGTERLHLCGDSNHLNRLHDLRERHDGSALVLRRRGEISRRRVSVLRLRVLAREQHELGHVLLKSLRVQLRAVLK